ncbi:MAG TPA: GNAT family N-acetyltransferase [Acidimicrobiales bacterium]|nr:GNAT family N-acetyltransferase [Acidimicrobiales bacterium]
MAGGPAAEAPPGYPARWEADAVLSDGGTVHIRPIRPGDRQGIVDLHDRLSDETIYLRFFSPIPRLSDALLDRFTQVDYVDRLALVAELGDRLVAVARYDRIAGRDEAEVAFVVEDAHQGRGLGTLMLEHLAAAAKHAGIRRFVADTLPNNQRMLHVFLDAGFGAERRFSEGVVRVVFPIEPTPESVRAMHEREHRAAARSVARLLSPRTVALVGASRRPGTVGHAVFRHILGSGFTGTVYPVHDRADSVGGVRAYRSVADIPDPVDLAVVMVPAPAVEEVVEQCAAAGVGGLVIISSGFGETGADGAAAERRIVLTAHRHGMRVIGPNCMGVANTDPGTMLNATLAPRVPGPGPVGLMAQAGALGIAILAEAASRGLGISTFVSAGNKADVSGNDLLHYWEEDPATRVILLYLESFGNPRTFNRIVRRISRTKPVVVVKGGRTAAGVRAVHHHTGAVPAPEAPVDALFHQAGVIRVDSLDQLLDVAQALAMQPLPEGRRVGIVGNAGGPGVLAADACEGAGLEVPDLSDATRALLAPLVVGDTVDNPVNLDPDAPPGDYERAIGAVLDDPGVDAVLVHFAPPIMLEGRQATDRIEAVAGAIAAAAAQVARPSPKPVVANFLAMRGTTPALGRGAGGVPSFAFPESAAHALSKMADLGEWRRRPEGTFPELPDIDRQAAADLAVRALVAGGGWLDQEGAATLLASYGVGVSSAAVTDTRIDVVQDPSFGPLISLLVGPAAGGAGRPVLRIAPLTDSDADEMVAAAGGSPPAGLDDVLLRVGQLAADRPEVAEASISVAPGPGASDVRLRMASVDPHPELSLRRLR